MTRSPISVLIPCFNNEDIIEECLRTVRWADEVVVVDSFSTDRTLDMARPLVDRIVQREYGNSASQKNWAIPQAAHDWVLIVDTDERVTEQLRAEIESVLDSAADCVGFRIPRANHVFGRWLRHGNNWPDFQIRLFRKDCGRYENRAVHAHVVLNGRAGTLQQPLQHFPHRSLGVMRQTLLRRYTTWEAAEKNKQGVRFHWYQLAIRPPGAFLYRYVWRGGWRDGWQGLLMACVWACYVLITYVKLRAVQSGDRE